jgi:hypothetical protein
VFSAWALPRTYLEDNWLYSSVAGYSPKSNDVSAETEEPLLLEAVARERLLKTQEAGYRLSERCGDL